MININQIFEEVKQYFHLNLPKYLTYHNWDHTLSVYKNARHIGKKEGLKKGEIDLLSIAALFHDIAYIESRTNHEERSFEIAKEWLKKYNINSEDLLLIQGMIMATKIPQQPTTHMEKVLSDADLLYLGSTRYEAISQNLFIEFKHYNPELSDKQWLDLQIGFLSEHSFHTNFCKHYYKWKKIRTLNDLISNKPL